MYVLCSSVFASIFGRVVGPTSSLTFATYLLGTFKHPLHFLEVLNICSFVTFTTVPVLGPTCPNVILRLAPLSIFCFLMQCILMFHYPKRMISVLFCFSAAVVISN